MITAAMMNEAVTGTARPSTSTATAASTQVTSRTPVGLSATMSARSTMIDDRSSPRPVSVSTATMRPAAAQVAATGSTPIAPLASAASSRGGVMRVDRSRNDSAKATTLA